VHCQDLKGRSESGVTAPQRKTPLTSTRTEAWGFSGTPQGPPRTHSLQCYMPDGIRSSQASARKSMTWLRAYHMHHSSRLASFTPRSSARHWCPERKQVLPNSAISQTCLNHGILSVLLDTFSFPGVERAVHPQFIKRRHGRKQVQLLARRSPSSAEAHSFILL
jgi:hypothetical protein